MSNNHGRTALELQASLDSVRSDLPHFLYTVEEIEESHPSCSKERSFSSEEVMRRPSAPEMPTSGCNNDHGTTALELQTSLDLVRSDLRHFLYTVEEMEESHSTYSFSSEEVMRRPSAPRMPEMVEQGTQTLELKARKKVTLGRKILLHCVVCFSQLLY